MSAAGPRQCGHYQQGDLWVSNSLVENGLARLKTNGQWQSYDIKNYSTQNHHLGELIIDDYNQKWFIVAKGGGIIVYNDNNTPDLANDDSDKHLSITQGQGGLPSNLVLSLAKDKDGEIWVGTDKGIAVFYNPESIFQEQIINSQQILVEVDGYVEPILDSESITAIAIDGANRKWIGTHKILNQSGEPEFLFRYIRLWIAAFAIINQPDESRS